MQGLLAGLLVLSVTYFGGKGLLQRFFFRTGYVYAEETERAEELQEYVTQNKLSASDYKMMERQMYIYMKEQRINILTY